MSTATQSPETSSIRTEGTHISLSGVTKDYGLERPAVADVDLEIGGGEFVSFLGPSGSGKTTTLNMIAGLETVTRGTVSLDGVDVSHLPAYKRNLGMLFQNYALFPHMTVAQNVAYPLRERKVGRAQIKERVAAVLELVQLTGREAALPKQLSGGQQQRVALARSIVFNPRALLLDEPLGALDKNLRAALQLELRRIHREVGSTFVFVTHDQEEAMTLSDRIVLFREGGVEQVGTPEELYERPNTLFAARFLGDSNTFRVTPGADHVSYGELAWPAVPETVAPGVAEAKSAYVVVRPEHMQVAHDEPVPAGTPSISVRVHDVEYVGSFQRVVARTTDRDELITAKLSPGSATPDVGDEIKLWWRPQSQRIVIP
ncbi:ABC transporter ATP-binding protein [Ornithinimicrobium faecis]|uniref:Spermidine/putrescine import ATP-binding protein PotA n=1 Tax=Ornithinimicrobium faecis TaxID=2934158 RepID=A0ABY4YQJ5_9MICO|nr:ABC transporter ATP-binding protein [Ornithinimicrobium sp. HY1793]USQ79021.1 ABC transporter ATP-binding protein [Ornithinimicrobium sp. HY1793]